MSSTGRCLLDRALSAKQPCIALQYKALSTKEPETALQKSLRVCVHECACVRACVHACMHAGGHACMRACVRAYAYMYACACERRSMPPCKRRHTRLRARNRKTGCALTRSTLQHSHTCHVREHAHTNHLAKTSRDEQHIP